MSKSSFAEAIQSIKMLMLVYIKQSDRKGEYLPIIVDGAKSIG